MSFPYMDEEGNIITKSGEAVHMTDTATFKELKHETYLKKATRNAADLEYALDIVLAHTEAERQVNAWLDLLNDPKATKRQKGQIKKLLRETAEEYKFLADMRQSLEIRLKHKLKNAKK